MSVSHSLLPATAPLVSVDWLATNLHERDVIIIDASWHMPAEKRDGHAEYIAGHIPGAIFFDLDGLSDHTTTLPHMLLTPHAFAEAAGALGVSETNLIVVYDYVGVFSAPRVWWNFKTYGAKNVVVLNGGLPAWRAASLPLEQGAVTRPHATFTPQVDTARIADSAVVTAALASGAQVLDARATARFSGAAPEPRAGLASGHMPGAKNLPWQTLLDNGFLKPAPDLVKAFARAGIDTTKPVLTTCGSGVSAAILSLALAVISTQQGQLYDGALYDGSWSEWGQLGEDGKPLRAVAVGA